MQCLLLLLVVLLIVLLLVARSAGLGGISMGLFVIALFVLFGATTGATPGTVLRITILVVLPSSRDPTVPRINPESAALRAISLAPALRI